MTSRENAPFVALTARHPKWWKSRHCTDQQMHMKWNNLTHNNKAVMYAVILYSNAKVCLILPEYCSVKQRIKTSSNSNWVSSIVMFLFLDVNEVEHLKHLSLNWICKTDLNKSATLFLWFPFLGLTPVLVPGISNPSNTFDIWLALSNKHNTDVYGKG